MTYPNARALLAALGVYFLSQIVIAGAPVIDSSTSSAFTTLPAPTGPFAVGKITVHWTDASRIEPLSLNHEPRELMVDIWYPAEPLERSPRRLLGYSGLLQFRQKSGQTPRRDRDRDGQQMVERASDLPKGWWELTAEYKRLWACIDSCTDDSIDEQIKPLKAKEEDRIEVPHP